MKAAHLLVEILASHQQRFKVQGRAHRLTVEPAEDLPDSLGTHLLCVLKHYRIHAWGIEEKAFVVVAIEGDNSGSRNARVAFSYCFEKPMRGC
jgi:hypothetical protein